MRNAGLPPQRLMQSNFRDSYWTLAQLVAHHTVNGCNLQAGDLFGSGTQSGPDPGQGGSLLELSGGGKQPLQLANGETRSFLEDGDTVILRGHCARAGFRRIGFGDCAGTIAPAHRTYATMQRQLSEIEKHGAAAGDNRRPHTPDWTIDQGWDRYTAAEHGVWKTLFERQTRLLPGRACDEFVAGMRDLPITADGIPDFRRLSDVLLRRTPAGRSSPFPASCPTKCSSSISRIGAFPPATFIRKPDELDYLEEPDVFHDVFGHVPMLMNPVIADYIQAYGEGGLRAQKLGVLGNLARVYWYTVEFGLVEQARRLAHLRLGHRVVVYGIGVRARRSVAQPHPLRPRARDAHPLPDRRFPGDVLRAPQSRRSAGARAYRFRPAV